MAVTIKLSNNKKRQLTALAEQAVGLAKNGHHPAALKICAKADVLYRDHPDTMYARGLIAALQRDNTKAIEWFERACHAAPKRLEFMVNYAGCLLMNEQEEQAAEIYPKILAKSPRLFEAVYGYGVALEAIGEFQHALQVFEKALSLDPRNIKLIQKVADMRNDFAETKDTMTLLEKAHSIAPDNAQILYDMGIYLVQQGELKAARIHFRKALTLDPEYVKALGVLINSGRYDQRDEDLAQMRKLYSQSEHMSEQQAISAFVLGKAADSAKEYDQAFAYWAEANHLHRQFIRYDEAEQETMHQAAMEAFTAQRFSEPVSIETSKAAPIFIAGTPRCGSTLLEQALSRHPALQASGEMYAMQQSIVGRKRKVCNADLIKKLKTLDDKEMADVGKEYERRILHEYGLQGRVLDKTLNNYMYAGLIARALPRARIIHIKREPMAACLSMYQENFAGSLPYAFDLDELGRQYIRYQKLMQHWREVLPAGVMLETSYEDLVSTPEAELRRLLEGCGLEWHEDCLSSHKSKGVVTTASIFQVRKPMHQKSVARWKHYEKQLAPLRKLING
ncbi:Tfp pilus assembly protein PilF [Mariprofundus aestuarium]|uniref:Tfp pilus assembly protein PilF n=1 Tax=Mariprofundus aestuarium TaxID=1921086 RepID=A0A2K8L0F3_MARES|nr:sulfotransferase [Mariprofundus aestuarium]ATX80785.1 Tfp pilus assembly protein PilF [Mariprofundus aestuarium]